MSTTRSSFSPLRYLSIIFILVFTAVALQAQDAEDSLRYGYHRDVPGWDAHLTQSDWSMLYYQLIYDALLTEDSDGNLLPQLATEWVVEDSQITFTLRDDVVFSDGTAFDASVVQANIERIQNGSFRPLIAQLRSVESVEVVDDFTVQFNLSSPDPALLLNLSRHAGVMLSPASFENARTEPIGSGPYTLNLEDSLIGVSYLFDKSDSFWGASDIAIAQIEIRVAGGSALMNAMLAGELDVFAPVGTRNVPRLEEQGYEVIGNIAGVGAFNILDRAGTIVPEFADERVRCALSHAIDRQAMSEALTNGASIITAQYPLAGTYGAPSDVDLSYNPDLARELLAEAGAENLTFTVPIASSSQQSGQGSNSVIQGFFADVGVTMEFESVDNLQQAINSGEYPAAFSGISDRHVVDFVRSRLLQRAQLNPFGVVNDNIEALYQEALALPNDEAESVWANIAQQAMTQCVVIPYLANDSRIAISPDVVGAEAFYLMTGVINLRQVELSR